MRETLRRLFLLACLAVGAAVLFLGHDLDRWSMVAAIAFATGAFSFVIALPDLRHDDEVGGALVSGVFAVALLAASAVLAVYVIHSWRWLGFAGTVGGWWIVEEVWNRARGGESVADDGESDIDRDIREKQERQDAQLPKTYPHV